jgi:hypothetical protein
VTLEEARASRAPSGAPAWEIEGWVTSYAVIAAASFDVVTIRRAADGHPPMHVARVLEATRRAWAH